MKRCAKMSAKGRWTFAILASTPSNLIITANKQLIPSSRCAYYLLEMEQSHMQEHSIKRAYSPLSNWRRVLNKRRECRRFISKISVGSGNTSNIRRVGKIRWYVQGSCNCV